MADAIRVTYLVRSDPDQVRARADALLLEQTVELPRAALPRSAAPMVGQLERVEPAGEGRYRVVILQPLGAAANDPAQLLNLIFGNSSLQPDVVLEEVRLPEQATGFLPGPQFGIAGLRAISGVTARPLVATALKPMGLPPEALARLARDFALAGLDVVKDDHGLADHAGCRFEHRVEACLAAVDQAFTTTGRRTLYVPNLIGTPARVREQLGFAQAAGARAVLLSPMLLGLPFLAELAREARIPIVAHPSLAGVRAAEPALLGTLFRWYGADAVIFPHAGGRFSYSRDICARLAETLRAPDAGLRPALPVPAGGIRLDGVSELLAFYGADCMLLIGGSLYQAGDRLIEVTRALVERVAAESAEGARTG
jgi:S-methyl-5-thioribulose 1-phosphate isomerase